MMSSNNKREILTFSLTTIALSSLICFIAYQTGNSGLSILSVFTPSIVALTLTVTSKGKKGVYELFVEQTIRKIKIKWLIISLIGIPFIAFMAELTSLNFDISKFDLRTYQLMPQVLVIILIALGEEYGWRGFLLPRLFKEFNVFYSSMILGLIWGFWHFPAYLIGMGVPLDMNFMMFLIWVILGTLFMSWIYYYTKSVLTAILAHISANAAFNYLYILPEFTGDMNTFGTFLLFFLIVLILVYYLKRKDLLKRPAKRMDAS